MCVLGQESPTKVIQKEPQHLLPYFGNPYTIKPKPKIRRHSSYLSTPVFNRMSAAALSELGHTEEQESDHVEL